jgi:lipid A 3-O-deacylase
MHTLPIRLAPKGLRYRQQLSKALATQKPFLGWLPGASMRSDASPARTIAAALLLLAVTCGCQVASAQVSALPNGAFMEAGTWGSTHQVAAGVIWDWQRRWLVGPGSLTGYWEASLSEWSYPSMDGRRSATLGQLGLIPVFRYRLTDESTTWFAELGIGLTLMTTVYETQRKRFSTAFNFGDHVAIGRSFGDSGRHELAFRLEHFSNAGISEPNPGQNFFQLRYTYRFQ